MIALDWEGLAMKPKLLEAALAVAILGASSSVYAQQTSGFIYGDGIYSPVNFPGTTFYTWPWDINPRPDSRIIPTIGAAIALAPETLNRVGGEN
jgi:hypothetical protein